MNKLFPLLAFSALLLVPLAAEDAFAVTIFQDDFDLDPAANGWIETFPPNTNITPVALPSGSSAGFLIVSSPGGDADLSIFRNIDFTGMENISIDIRVLRVDQASYEIDDIFSILVNGFSVYQADGTDINGFNPATSGTSTLIQLPAGTIPDNSISSLEILFTSDSDSEDFFIDQIIIQGDVISETPATLTKISGDSQSGVVGMPLSPFVVQVTDEFDNPLQDIVVAFELQQSGAQLSCTNAFTDSQGMASCTLTPQEEGDFNVIISLPGFDTVAPLTCSASGFFESQGIGGKIIPIESTSLILAGTQTFSFMIPVILSVLGIGIFVVSKKTENS